MPVYFSAVFDPDQTLDCGQSFRWKKEDTRWQGVAFGRELSLHREGDSLIFSFFF